MKEFLKSLLQLILSPRNGWEDIEKAALRPSQLLGRGLFPLMALAAVSVFAQALFLHHVVFLKLFMRMIITFVVYFISYFFSTFVLSLTPLVAESSQPDEDERAQTFTIYTLGLLALISIVVNLLPVTPLVLFFLPCYVALVQWKGCAYMRIPEGKQGLFMTVAIPGVLLPPYIFYFVFSFIF